MAKIIAYFNWTNMTEELPCSLVTSYYLGFQIVSDAPIGYFIFYF